MGIEDIIVRDAVKLTNLLYF